MFVVGCMGMSEVYRLKSKGERIVPCGTPADKILGSEYELFTPTVI